MLTPTYSSSYLLTIDSVYQEYLAKTLTDKYGNLSVQMDKIINDANSEIENLHHKLDGQSPISGLSEISP